MCLAWRESFGLVLFSDLQHVYCPTACGILVPQPGIKPVPLARKHGVLTTGPPGKSIEGIFFSFFLYLFILVGG